MDERMDMKPQKPGKSISPDIPRLEGRRGARRGTRAGQRERKKERKRERVCNGEILMNLPLSSVIKSARCNALFGFTAISLCSEFEWRNNGY